MIRTMAKGSLMAIGMGVICLALAGCDDTPTGPQGQTPPPETPPPGVQPVETPGDMTPTSVSGSGGATRGGGG